MRTPGGHSAPSQGAGDTEDPANPFPESPREPAAQREGGSPTGANATSWAPRHRRWGPALSLSHVSPEGHCHSFEAPELRGWS